MSPINERFKIQTRAQAPPLTLACGYCGFKSFVLDNLPMPQLSVPPARFGGDDIADGSAKSQGIIFRSDLILLLTGANPVMIPLCNLLGYMESIDGG